MRPTRVELEGFGSFRKRTELDLAEAELFVLTGPTGAGKSTVIDAMIFALYGSVPRYQDRRLVAPVISQGMAEARIRLDFAIGSTSYTAVRVVRRTKTGATTKEARLEDTAGRTLAGNAEELTSRVNELLGLSFEQFVRCVVLPQGDFAAFMRAKPSERQDLLVGLLGLGEYERIGELARRRAAMLDSKIEQLDRLLTALADATLEALDESAKQLQLLDDLIAKIDESRPQIEALDRSLTEVRGQLEIGEAQCRTVAAVNVPAGVDQIAARVTAAAEEAGIAEADAEMAEALADETAESLAAMPDEAELKSGLDRLRRLAQLEAEYAQFQAHAAEAEGNLKTVSRNLDSASAAVSAARDELDRLRRAHAAQHLAEEWQEGDPCPVCLRELDSMPERKALTALTSAENQLRKAQAAEKSARSARDEVSNEYERLHARRESRERQIAQLRDEIGDAPSTAEHVESELVRIASARTAADEARKQARAARKKANTAADAVKAVSQEAATAWKVFDKARDAVASLAPPEADRSDIATAWAALAEWAKKTALTQKEVLAGLRKTVDAQQQERTRLRDEILALCSSRDVAVSDKLQPRDVAVAAAERERARGEQIRGRIAEAEELRTERASAHEAAAVAKDLGLLLSAQRFEAWLLNRALEQLVHGATATLKELSSGAYSLALTDTNEFEVIDHRNADERRSAKTLSGGETFLASLSLALALSDHVAQLAAGQTARLDALFLDEGFGTLDPDTLDTVAAAIEELGARGRMVGLITHVRDLADRIPVRYEVRKVGGSSTIERSAA